MATRRSLIAYFTKNTVEVGLFGIGAMLASVLGMFTGAFQQAWGPFAFSLINNPDAIESQLLYGRGRAYGLEFLLKKKYR